KPCIVAGQGVARPDADRRIASKLAVPRHRREKSCHQSYDQQPENERNDTYWIHLPSVLRGLLEKPFYQSRFQPIVPRALTIRARKKRRGLGFRIGSDVIRRSYEAHPPGFGHVRWVEDDVVCPS